MNEREKLLHYITAVSFAIDDCVLYLDTHPYDKEALEYYSVHKELRKKALKQYTENFGPLLNDNVDVSCGKWTWIDQPWPWEGGC
ncbi:spore coat protein JB [Mobilisporobacter senegalensis]|uniref:Spore coat protein JB n=1 Tax=Mobilisporobacter senegalensis TaxID=1329262 RepID=A0A3N1XNY8_9FIRM|nr:spore coat protein CotJB [Mobilisporobacter senegalensis]ROR28375.1 spore coat protein JB [Mobilisporobacter senegalensis]